MKNFPLLLLAPLCFGATSSLLALPVTEVPFKNIITTDVRAHEFGSRANQDNALQDRAPEEASLPPENTEQNSSSSSACNTIETINRVIGVPPQLVLNWVTANSQNDLTTRDRIFNEIVDLIENRRAQKLSEEDLNDLRTELLASSLDSQEITPNAPFEFSTKSEGSKFKTDLSTDEHAWHDVGPKPTSLAGLLDALHEQKLGHLIPAILRACPQTVNF